MFLALLFSCKKDTMNMTDPLKKRVVIIEDFIFPAAPSGETKYVADSIVEYYDNKRIIDREFYTREEYDADFDSVFMRYEYSAQGLLSKVRFYNDLGQEDDYALQTYSYNGQSEIEDITYEKFSSSNLSDNLSHTSTSFNYVANTIERTKVNHLNNDSIIGSNQFVLYGNIDSIYLPDTYAYNFDNQDDLSSIICTGSNCDSLTINWYYEYGSSRVPLVENSFGSRLNLFLAGEPFVYHNFEISEKYLQKRYYNYPYVLRNGNTRVYEYIFDDEGRLTEAIAGGSYSFGHVVRYYYE